MKKVIFVASTSYSGSTFLDMTLGNDPKGFSIGEVNALFEPVEPHHYHPVCGCHQSDCTIWERVKEKPVSQLYATLFELFPDIDFIIDSSKEPLWVNARIEELKQQGIDYRIALIWKSPLEIAQSFDKRGDYNNWERAWVNYHRLLYSLQPEKWVTVSYHDYAAHPESLKDLCERLEIPYFDGKEKFWEKTHHLLFGNHSARKHLLRSHKDNQQVGALDDFQKIIYKPVDDPVLEQRVNAAIKANPVIADIQTVLESLTHGDNKAASSLSRVKMSFLDVFLRQAKQQLRLLKGKFLIPKN